LLRMQESVVATYGSEGIGSLPALWSWRIG
jgi:hypothetical protein